MALAASMTVPVVGALLMFALMIGPAAAARSFDQAARVRHRRVDRHRAGHRLGRHRASYRTNWPLGFYVGVIAAGFFLLGQAWAAVRRRGSAARAVPALSTAQ